MRALGRLAILVFSGFLGSCGPQGSDSAGNDGTLPAGDAVGGAGAASWSQKPGEGSVLDTSSSGGSGGSDSGPDAACATETVESTLQPLAIYVLLDRSKSMDSDDKWNNAVTALAQFVDAPEASGIKIALSYFPLEQGQCDGTGYSTPYVPMGVLPANAAAISDSLQTMPPGGQGSGTPMEGALHGIDHYCAAYAQQNPAEKIVGVLITDGQPNGCDEDPAALSAIASHSYAADPPVPVFAIGMDGADFGVLDEIATAGGSQQSFDVSQGGTQAFLQALQTIAGTSLPCEIALPAATGQSVDPSKVNVTYTDAGVEKNLGRVPDASFCVPNAWYYDDPQNPTRIILCPDTCAAVRASAQGKIGVVLGCATIAPPAPR